MTPGEFLRAVWPAEGLYCIATPFVIPGSDPPRSVYAHKVFDDVSQAVSFVLNKLGSTDIFFAIHTLKEQQVWNSEKLNLKTGERGSNEVRVQRNMRAARSFFFDLDVGEAANKYPSQGAAIEGLITFCEKTGLPKPLLVSSGGGIHVYWIVTEPLDSADWRDQANKLKQLALHYGLKIDTSRTTDTASVLRVAGTFNYKDRSKPRPVEALTPAQEIGTGLFIKMVDEAMIRGGIEAKPLPRFDPLGVSNVLGTNTVREYQGAPVSLKAVLLSCAQMRRLALAAEAKQHITEPEWYHGVVGVGRFLEDGHRRILQFGDPAWYPTIREKIKQSEQHQKGPTSCAKLAEISSVGDEPCIGCPFAGKVHGPVQAARYYDPAPAPEVKELVGLAEQPIVITIPDPPSPFVRLKGGGVAVHAEDADGNKTYQTIYEHDLYPIRRLVNPQAGTEQQVWHVGLPRGEAKDFTLDADMLYDSRKFTAAISHQGVYPHKGNIPGLQEYMVAYIQQLQRLVDADAQCNHLGWSDDFERFILPDKIMSVDGTIKSTQLSLGAERASIHVHKKGDAKKQAELLRFYDRPEYLAHQFFILCGLAAPIFYATGNHGVIVNASGHSGASKSTSLYTAASFWGQPKLYPINGTNNGATIRGRNERVTVLANLPVCVDEITHMASKDAIDLAMSITQPGHRIRLDTTGVERANLGSYKSTIMMATANNSLHGLLSENNSQGTAGSMRVFEIAFPVLTVHTKAEADSYLHALEENYGHLGEVFVAYVLSNREKVVKRVREVVCEVDAALGIQASERFWSATIATVLVAGEIANELGIVSYNVAAIRHWVLTHQVPAMRGIVREEYSDPLGVLTDYLEQISASILVIDASGSAVGGAATYMAKKPMGALLAHYDRPEQLLYVLRKGFKDHCGRIGANALKILDELHETREGERIVSATSTKRTLGAGTEYSKGQSNVFVVNMAHKAISGAIDLRVIEGGGEGSADEPPGLHIVR